MATVKPEQDGLSGNYAWLVAGRGREMERNPFVSAGILGEVRSQGSSLLVQGRLRLAHNRHNLCRYRRHLLSLYHCLSMGKNIDIQRNVPMLVQSFREGCYRDVPYSQTISDRPVIYQRGESCCVPHRIAGADDWMRGICPIPMLSRKKSSSRTFSTASKSLFSCCKDPCIDSYKVNIRDAVSFDNRAQRFF